jgi:hypothetical protein
MTVVIVSGSMVAKRNNGGEPWVRLSWIEGLRRLGFDVYFVEQIDPASCVDASGRAAPVSRSVNLQRFQQIVRDYNLADRASLIASTGESAFGLSYSDLRDVSASAALLVNITGNLRFPELKSLISKTAYIDEDPGYTQFWHLDGHASEALAGHEYYFTVGENIGKPSCTIPGGDIHWRTISQFVVLDMWPVHRSDRVDRFTTVATWRGTYGAVSFGGKQFGQRVHEFRKIITLPRASPYTYEVALDIDPGDKKDLDALHENGWHLVNPGTVAATPSVFQQYVQGSSAEFSVAQGIYVETNSGWFSDRSVRYLASGKPVLVQDTGFGDSYPTGEGLLTFGNLDQARAGSDRIVREYDCHAAAARAIAVEYFDARKVLPRFLEAVDVAP